MKQKKDKPCIAPLQPPTLATFRSWGNSAGAGRTGLIRCKIINNRRRAKGKDNFFGQALLFCLYICF